MKKLPKLDLLDMVIIIICVAVLSTMAMVAPANAAEWDDHNTAMEVGYVIASVLDMNTTMDIRNHDNIEEVGPAKLFLGANPEPLPTVVYFAATTAAHYAISRALPSGYREVWQAVTLTVEGGYAYNNMRLGLKWSF